MRTLIVPCAGSRTIDNLPLFLKIHPNNDLLAINAIKGVFPDQYDKIIFTVLKEVDEKYNATELITKANNGRYNIDFVLLTEKTFGPAETVYKSLLEANVQGEFAVRDCHAFLSLGKDYRGNFVAGLDLTSYEKPIENLREKSFISINEQGRILDIVEKHFCSDVISTGFYGFKSAVEYIKAYERLRDPNYEIKKLYLSHVISYMIGYSQKVFHMAIVNDFEDWSTNIAWQKVQKSNSLCFIDMNAVHIEGSLKEKLIKLNEKGVTFVGYSCLDINSVGCKLDGINFLTIVGNCPNTYSKKLISCEYDIDRLFLEI